MDWDDEELDTQIFDKDHDVAEPESTASIRRRCSRRTTTARSPASRRPTCCARRPRPSIWRRRRRTWRPERAARRRAGVRRSPPNDHTAKAARPPAPAGRPASPRSTLVGVPPSPLPPRPAVPPPVVAGRALAGASAVRRRLGAPGGASGRRRPAYTAPHTATAITHGRPSACPRPARARADARGAAAGADAALDQAQRARGPLHRRCWSLALVVVGGTGCWYWWSLNKPGHAAARRRSRRRDGADRQRQDRRPLAVTVEKAARARTCCRSRTTATCATTRTSSCAPGQQRRWRSTLEASPDTGFELTSEPPGGLVWLDGVPIKRRRTARRAPTSAPTGSPPATTSRDQGREPLQAVAAGDRDRAGHDQEDPRDAGPGRRGRAGSHGRPPPPSPRRRRAEARAASRSRSPSPRPSRAGAAQADARRDAAAARRPAGPAPTARAPPAARRRASTPRAGAARRRASRRRARRGDDDERLRQRPGPRPREGGDCSITHRLAPLVRGLDRRQEHRPSTRRSPTTRSPAASTSSASSAPICRSTTPRSSGPAGPEVQAVVHARARRRAVAIALRAGDSPRACRRCESLRCRPAVARRRRSGAGRRRGRTRWSRPGASISGTRTSRRAHPAARDFMDRDLQAALARLIPADASVLEAGCGLGDLLASLPNARPQGHRLPARDGRPRRAPRHPDDRRSRSTTPPRPIRRRRPAPARAVWDAIVCDRLCHSVLDIRALLAGLRARLADGGRIYLTAFNYLWEVPTRLAELARLEAPGADGELAVRQRLPQPVRHHRARGGALRGPADAAARRPRRCRRR